MNHLSNNDHFQDLLQQVDEYELVCTAIYFVPFAKQQQSLIGNEEFLHDFLRENFSDFGFTETEDPALIHSENALFLVSQTREEKVHLYREFMSSNAVIEDLLCLDLDERVELLMELGLEPI